jgi:hypothetical protein
MKRSLNSDGQQFVIPTTKHAFVYGPLKIQKRFYHTIWTPENTKRFYHTIWTPENTKRFYHTTFVYGPLKIQKDFTTGNRPAVCCKDCRCCQIYIQSWTKYRRFGYNKS